MTIIWNSGIRNPDDLERKLKQFHATHNPQECGEFDLEKLLDEAKTIFERQPDDRDRIST